MLTSSGALGQPTNTTLVIGGVDSVNAIFDENKLNPHFPDELVNRCPEMEIML